MSEKRVADLEEQIAELVLCATKMLEAIGVSPEEWGHWRLRLEEAIADAVVLTKSDRTGSEPKA